ncbi:MAG: hypothetical protein L0H84_15955, partial [Pseudonocardia sp.]|nr:hypothetical protein [Pseudonocardia sp.]
MELDAARLVVLAGDPGDVVARFPGVVCVARSPEPDLLRQLLRLCADAAGPDPGRTLARSLARWLAGADDLPDRIEFGTVSTAGDQLAVFLSGATAVEIDSSVLSGTDAAAWTDRLLTAPSGPVRLALQDSSGRRSGLVPELLDLRAGVVPGAGAELVPGGAVATPRPAEQAAGAGVLEEEPVGRSPLAPDPVPPQRPPGNGVGPPIELDKVADPAKAQPVGSPAPLPVPQVPEQPDEPGADEEFTSGEWFGAAAEADQRTARPGADDSSAEPSAPSSGQAGRHAVHGLGEATEEASGLGAPDRPS